MVKNTRIMRFWPPEKDQHKNFFFDLWVQKVPEISKNHTVSEPIWQKIEQILECTDV